MDATLGLALTLPSAASLVLALGNRLRRVPVPNALVSAIQKRVVGDVVLLDVRLHLRKAPRGQRVDLDKAGLVDLNYLQRRPLRALRAATTRQHSGDAQLGIGALCGLDLSDPVVQLVVRLPQLGAVAGLELGCGGTALGGVDVQTDVGVTGTRALDQIERLAEVVEGVEEDGVDGGCVGRLGRQLGEHVEGDKPGETEGSDLVEVGEGDLAPAKHFDGAEVVEGVVDELQVLACQHDLGQRRGRGGGG